MWRFVAVLVLALVGMVWCVFFAGDVMRWAFVTAFAAALVLPPVMNPTRHWARGFFLCFDMVYAASGVGANWGQSRISSFQRSCVERMKFDSDPNSYASESNGAPALIRNITRPIGASAARR